MEKINWVAFHFDDKSHDFKVQCSCNSSHVLLRDLCEHTQNLNYEERMNSNIGMPLNLTDGFVNKNTHICILEQVVELCGEYYKLTEKDITHYHNTAMILFKFSHLEDFDVTEHYPVYSNDTLMGILKASFSDAEFEAKRNEYIKSCVTIRIEEYANDDYSKPVKAYGFTFDELELARKTFAAYEKNVGIFVFGNYWDSKRFLNHDEFVNYLHTYHGIKIA